MKLFHLESLSSAQGTFSWPSHTVSLKATTSSRLEYGLHVHLLFCIRAVQCLHFTQGNHANAHKQNSSSSSKAHGLKKKNLTCSKTVLKSLSLLFTSITSSLGIKLFCIWLFLGYLGHEQVLGESSSKAQLFKRDFVFASASQWFLVLFFFILGDTMEGFRLPAMEKIIIFSPFKGFYFEDKISFNSNGNCSKISDTVISDCIKTSRSMPTSMWGHDSAGITKRRYSLCLWPFWHFTV